MIAQRRVQLSYRSNQSERTGLLIDALPTNQLFRKRILKEQLADKFFRQGKLMSRQCEDRYSGWRRAELHSDAPVLRSRSGESGLPGQETP